MMDSRFHLKLTFSIYGKDYPWDCSLNWSAERGQIDRRITEFFLKSHDDAFEEWRQQFDLDRDKANKAETEIQERNELKRLQQKYSDVR